MFIKKHLLKILLTITAAVFLFIIYSAYSIWSFSNKNQLVKTDAAIVLGAATWEGEPSPVFRERINHAIWLYENGYVEKIILTGGKGEGEQFAESEVAREYAIPIRVNYHSFHISLIHQLRGMRTKIVFSRFFNVKKLDNFSFKNDDLII
ncbi:YdcF family protein [Ureibacillus sp. MALMAid1270]|uniref:YdcF family protein n=1 Tax=Ureibacillus sp. MALMAid1270 TaxID=3411629 RepID=UPI003BA4A32C